MSKSIIEAFNELPRQEIKFIEPKPLQNGYVSFDLYGFREARISNPKVNVTDFFDIACEVMTNCTNANEPEKATFWIYQNGAYQKTEDFIFKIQKAVCEVLHDIGLPVNNYNTIGKQLIIKCLPKFNTFEDFDDSEFLAKGQYPIFLTDRVIIVSKDKIKKLSCSSKYRNRFAIPHSPKRKDTPLFDSHLRQITGGDQDYIETHLQIMATTLTPVRTDHNVYILEGEGGEGKSTHLNIIKELVGTNNASAVSIQDMTPTTIEPLAHALVNISTESGSGVFNETLIKALSSGDFLTANPKYRQPFSFMPRAKLLFSVNRKPNISDLSHSIRRRFVVLPFTNRITNPDFNFVAKLKSEMSGIVYKLILKLQKVIQQGGIYKCSAVETATSDYFQSANSVALFIAEVKKAIARYPDTADFLQTVDKSTLASETKLFCKKIDKADGFVTCIFLISRLYDCYKAWCVRFGYKFVHSKHFKDTCYHIAQTDTHLTIGHDSRREHLATFTVEAV